MIGNVFFQLITCFELKNEVATRVEWSSFCDEERRAKKRERKTEIVAIIKKIKIDFRRSQIVAIKK